MNAGGLIAATLLAAATAWRWRQLPKAVRAVAVAAVAALVAYGSGLVNPPSTEGEIRHLAASLGSYIYVLVGGLALLETGAGIGFIVPGEIAVVLGGVSAGQGEIALLPLIAVVWVCALAGDLISFTLGRRLGRNFLLSHGPRLGISRARIEQTERFYAAHGGKTLILGRFIGFVRPLSPFIAGASKMPARWFVPCTTLAAGIWAVTFSVLGYVFSQSLDEVISITERGTLAFSLIVVGAVIAIAVFSRARARRRPRRRPGGAPAAAEGE
jgi:membrane protein DedA with SNARE-associated domain